MVKRQLAIIGAACAALAGCGGARSSTLTGAGSTLVAPLVAQWQHRFRLTYAPVGSGAGIAQITSKTVDFGASDAPLQGDQRRPYLVQLPWALAATVIAVDLPGVTRHPRLTGPVLAAIYLGSITRWNDPAIARLNPALRLPPTRIAPLYRSDTSGDTYAFTGYLARASARWRTAVGSGTGVTWPAGTGARGNAGVAELLLQTPGAIAYVAIGQARRSRLQIAVLRNAAGTYSAPSPATIARAAAGAPTGYPLSTFSYVIVRRDSPKLAELKRFLRYAVGPGQSFATSVSFAPLPANVRRADLRIIARL